jgi:hypothetical protein
MERRKVKQCIQSVDKLSSLSILLQISITDISSSVFAYALAQNLQVSKLLDRNVIE